ncbi:MAG TPA: S8 family serine peptidase, partial [Burkholderiaceae bacterium]|nr:S8 family serine peptidase [Burkholderiaceae bacterium]
MIGASDADRGSVARGVALRVASGKVPVNLQGRRVCSLDLDALAKDAKTSEEFNQRVQSVFAAAAATRDEIILFVDQLHQYAGTRATAAATATMRSAIAANHISVIGGASPEAYDAYIGTDDQVASLFETISLDAVESAENTTAIKDKRKSPINQEFEGEKIAPDMRDLMASAGPHGQVAAIVQVSDVNSRQVRALLTRYGVTVGDRMPKLGAMKVDLPAEAIDALMKSNSMNYISPDVKVESLGHVTATTGTDQVRNAPGLLAGLLGASAIDGKGVGIAVLDSGLDSGHQAFTTGTNRIKFSKDFTGERNTTTDPYGHGTHVAGSAAAVSFSDGTKFQGMAPGASLINLRVLNSTGVGTTSAL